jgi:HSP20 family protein
MAIVRWEPLKDLDKFFESVQLTPFFQGSLDLAADVYEDGKDIIAEISAPGIDPDKINISIQNDHLRITGTREEERKVEKKNYYSREIRRGSFERLIPLPEHVVADQARAEFKDGVLRVIMPKKTGEPERKVKVERK